MLETVCPYCEGTGFEPSKDDVIRAPKPCPDCKGRGKVPLSGELDE